MKLITAIIRPHQLPAVKQSLYDMQVYKITVSNVLGCGEEEGCVPNALPFLLF